MRVPSDAFDAGPCDAGGSRLGGDFPPGQEGVEGENFCQCYFLLLAWHPSSHVVAMKAETRRIREMPPPRPTTTERPRDPWGCLSRFLVRGMLTLVCGS